MKAVARFAFSLAILFTVLLDTLPCGPGYTTPLFDTHSSPEDPYTDYAAGKLGIVKPTFHRSVLFAAYRYINRGGLTAPEQQAMIDVWHADFSNKDFVDNSIDDAVKAWIARRKEVIGPEEKVPEIYADRSYGGYEFFPNCTKNAFETASETLADRASAHGPNDPGVRDWIQGQDAVFQNCANGKQAPGPVRQARRTGCKRTALIRSPPLRSIHSTTTTRSGVLPRSRKIWTRRGRKQPITLSRER
jgi:hypothetical protein